MSKFTLFIFCLFTTWGAWAQSSSYRLVKVDLTSGYSRPSTAGLKGGFNLSIEPKVNITDQIAVGLKVEGAILASVDGDDLEEGYISVMQSTMLTSEYYLGTKMVRPYAGIGLGLYKATLFATDGELINIAGSDYRFGFAPRLGLQISHFRLGVEYNLVKDSNYFSIKIGTTIGGGRK